MMQVYFHTLGCKVNQYETEAIAETFLKNGYSLTLNEDEADIFLVNSCTVTAESDRKTRQLVRHLKRNHPDSIVILTGCMPQAFPEDAKNLTEADIVLGNRNNGKILEMLGEFLEKKKRVERFNEHERDEAFGGVLISDFNERTRASLKIEDGCDRFCTYCIIPYARGWVRSKPLADIEKEATALAEKGYHEIVLVGINLSSYGKGTDLDLADAVQAASKPEGIYRVRLGSLEPDHMTDAMLTKLQKCEKLCPQFHISLQSGADNTLKRMNRHYTAAEYKRVAEEMRKRFPDATITTDMMVGFAGETEADFLESVDFARTIGFEKIHVFPYSIREGTRAAKFPDQIERKEKARRAKILSEAATEIRNAYLERQIGRTLEVLLEHRGKGEELYGYTANYTPVKVLGEVPENAELVAVQIIKREGDFAVGTYQNTL